MIEWIDESDSRGLFLNGKQSPERTARQTLRQLADCLLRRVLGQGTVEHFEILLLEVGTDTGRLITAVTTKDKHEACKADGCSLRTQEVQDVWYDRPDDGVFDNAFEKKITSYEIGLGKCFREILLEHLTELRSFSAIDGFTYLVYGTERGEVLCEETFS